MTELKPPTKPVPDWQAFRDAWVRDVEGLAGRVQGWCREQNWPARRIARKLWDTAVGEHVVPAVLFQVELTQLLLEPVSPRLVGDGGLVELYHLPRYDNVFGLIWDGGGWHYYPGRDWTADFGDTDPPPQPFDRVVFVTVVERLVAHAQSQPA